MKKSDEEFSKIIDPWSDCIDIEGVKENKYATLHSYQRALFFSRFPKIEIKKKVDIVVMGVGIYKRLNFDLKKKTHVVVSARDILRDFSIIKELARSFTFDLSAYGRIYNQIIKNNPEYFLEVSQALEKIKPKVIVLKSTIDPINRIWAFYASKLNIKVVCMQHGIFSFKSNLEIMERNIIDYYIVLGAKQSEILRPVIPKNKHINMYESDNFYCNLKNKKNISVCFIGSDYERYSNAGKDRKKKMLDIYTNFIDILYQEKGVKYKFFYKMHPSESEVKSNRIIGLVEMIQKIDYDQIDVFIGVESTLLMQLASLGKCAIQLRSESLRLDNYQKLGYCGSIEVNTIKDKGLFTALEDSSPFPCLKEKSLSEIIINILKDIKNEN